jgi:hypothetical protein
MSLLHPTTFAALFLVIVSCVQIPERKLEWNTSLEQDLRSAQPVSYEFNRERMEALRQRLYRRMREDGDEAFANALRRQPDEVQTEVCNIMGLLEEKQFDKFPKTRYAISAAPKI